MEETTESLDIHVTVTWFIVLNGTATSFIVLPREMLNKSNSMLVGKNETPFD